MKIRTISTFAVGALAAATLAACSDNDAGDTTEVTPAPADSMATTPVEPMPPMTPDPAMPADGMTPPPVNDPAAMDPAATSPATDTPPAP
ncbi:hypothetical protein [Phenylobacterium sp.]|uniref:hypothetical protein n=1 Tax=Phenylobacterium sp. TaxID=1871053 RepID=UPI002730A164|nr:hypothetical protein [Phenylobacterium sp.]MDP1617351.1 hypothetical protein [Phenylobacterium sp.]MDP1986112.1 hypothetical protein [Phenylobacterium sp.]